MRKTRWDFYLAVSQSLPNKFSSLHKLNENLTHQHAKIMRQKAFLWCNEPSLDQPSMNDINAQWETILVRFFCTVPGIFITAKDGIGSMSIFIKSGPQMCVKKRDPFDFQGDLTRDFHWEVTRVDLCFDCQLWVKVFAFSFRPFASAELALKLQFQRNLLTLSFIRTINSVAKTWQTIP